LERIDIDTWERRYHFQRYVGTDFPYFVVTANVDVTNLLSYCRGNSLSSYISVVFVAHRAAQTIENLKYRIVDGVPMISTRMRPSFTYIPRDSELFIYVTVEYVDDIFEFHSRAKAQIADQGTDMGWETVTGRYDTIAYSGLPWIQYTQFTRSIAKMGGDSIPKMSWGRYFQQGDRILMPFSVQVHHGLVDGVHVGRLFEALQRSIDSLN
jgi:chloramphenicol O-acetyltransferase type A